MPHSSKLPLIELFPHVIDLAEPENELLQTLAEKALPDCLAHPGSGCCDLPGLPVVEISIVDDATIAEVHAQYLDDPTPTDVITFQHGELLVSYDTAKIVAREMGHSTLDELFLYIVHGLLHLNGHLDHETEEREKMHSIQNRIWRETLEHLKNH